jgi:hypothetical protein
MQVCICTLSFNPFVHYNAYVTKLVVVGKGIEAAVDIVYPGVEHRECMRHLWKNMKKTYFGPLFSQNMWAAAKTYSSERYNYHLSKIQEKCPRAIEWLDHNHPFIWSRSKFADDCKVDYINNNLSECFNSWISQTKSFQIVEMHDKIRQMIITKFDLRRKIGGNMNGGIIPSIIETLNDQSKAIKDHEVVKIGDGTAEVTVSNIRHAVNLEQRSCTCRSWQVTGKPCSHALAFIATLGREVDMADLVHQYYSVDMFRKAYAGVFTPMTSKQLWKQVDVGYTITKPQLRSKEYRELRHLMSLVRKRKESVVNVMNLDTQQSIVKVVLQLVKRRGDSHLLKEREVVLHIHLSK